MTESCPQSIEGISLAALRDAALQHIRQPLFLTISGAHLYGCSSPDSDFDLRGCHLGPWDEVFGLARPRQTLEPQFELQGREVEIVSHEIEKYLRLLLKPNGYVLEQIYSPLVAFTTAEHETIKELARGAITRRLYFHYRGFAHNELRLFLKEKQKKVKRILYLYRVLMTGIHLLRTGELNANILALNEHFQLASVPELVAIKQLEWSLVPDEAIYWADIDALQTDLDHAYETSTLPMENSGTDAMSRFLVGLRRRQLSSE